MLITGNQPGRTRLPFEMGAANGATRAAGAEAKSTPELLYHTTLRVMEPHSETGLATSNMYVLGTHTNPDDAKAFASKALESLGFKPEAFEELAKRGDTSHARRGLDDDVLVYARTPSSVQLLIGLHAKANTEGLRVADGGDGRVQLPTGADNLHYVIKRKTDYKQNVNGSFQTNEIEGCYVRREDALRAARTCLAGDCAEFAQYDERESVGKSDEWPFGEDTVVHAVAETGEMFTVTVQNVSDAYEQLVAKTQGGRG